MREITIGWKVSTLNLKLASLRYRALIPLLALEEIGVKSKVLFRVKASDLVKLDVLVIVKSFTLEDYWLAQEASKIGIPVIFDLCDNIFIGEYIGKHSQSPSEIFLQISNVASAVVVPTKPLAEIVRHKTNFRIPVYVVPDGLENPTILKAAKRKLASAQLYEFFYRGMIKAVKPMHQMSIKFSYLNTGSLLGIFIKFPKELIRLIWLILFKFCKHYFYWRYWAKKLYLFYDLKICKYVRSNTSTNSVNEKDILINNAEALVELPQKIVWFGSHGAEHASFGMLDLLLIRDTLEKLACEFSLELVVISNNRSKFEQNITPIKIPTRYVEWTSGSIVQYLREADVVVIPNSLDEFSICKSANRTVLALMNDAPVVATSTPALEDLRDCIVLNDFENGFRHYLTDKEFARNHVRKGQELIENLYGPKVIVGLWKEVIDKAIIFSKNRENIYIPEIIFVIHLPQDIELVTPLLEKAKEYGVQCTIWGSLVAIRRWPNLGKWIQSQGIDWRILPHDLKGVDVDVFPASVYALVSIVESNLNPHRFSHQLTKLANKAGLYTATLQHGFENVGLSYSDAVQAIERIKIASSKIYTWGSLDTLHQNIPNSIREKCLPVGCPKPANPKSKTIEGWGLSGRPVIGIFENLHWHRYSDDYRKFFIDSVMSVAEAFPDVDFLIKPHNAGLWLTNRYQGEIPNNHNLIIIDPKESRWSDVTASVLFGHFSGVVTTPSTVALDAARAKLPVAVVARAMAMDNYEPLPLINELDDWHSFIKAAIDNNYSKALKIKSQQFVDRVLLPSDAASRIVEDIVSHKQQQESKHAA